MKTIKKIKPAFVVDLTLAEDANDIFVCFGLAKQEASLPMTDREFESIISFTINESRKQACEATVKEIFQGHNAAIIKGNTIEPITLKAYDLAGDKKMVVSETGEVTIKKPNVFKRFWNWLTRKNK